MKNQQKFLVYLGIQLVSVLVFVSFTFAGANFPRKLKPKQKLVDQKTITQQENRTYKTEGRANKAALKVFKKPEKTDKKLTYRPKKTDRKMVNLPKKTIRRNKERSPIVQTKRANLKDKAKSIRKKDKIDIGGRKKVKFTPPPVQITNNEPSSVRKQPHAKSMIDYKHHKIRKNERPASNHHDSLKPTPLFTPRTTVRTENSLINDVSDKLKKKGFGLKKQVQLPPVEKSQLDPGGSGFEHPGKTDFTKWDSQSDPLFDPGSDPFLNGGNSDVPSVGLGNDKDSYLNWMTDEFGRDGPFSGSSAHGQGIKDAYDNAATAIDTAQELGESAAQLYLELEGQNRALASDTDANIEVTPDDVCNWVSRTAPMGAKDPVSAGLYVAAGAACATHKTMEQFGESAAQLYLELEGQNRAIDDRTSYDSGWERDTTKPTDGGVPPAGVPDSDNDSHDENATWEVPNGIGPESMESYEWDQVTIISETTTTDENGNETTEIVYDDSDNPSCKATDTDDDSADDSDDDSDDDTDDDTDEDSNDDSDDDSDDDTDDTKNGDKGHSIAEGDDKGSTNPKNELQMFTHSQGVSPETWEDMITGKPSDEDKTDQPGESVYKTKVWLGGGKPDAGTYIEPGDVDDTDTSGRNMAKELGAQSAATKSGSTGYWISRGAPIDLVEK